MLLYGCSEEQIFAFFAFLALYYGGMLFLVVGVPAWTLAWAIRNYRRKMAGATSQARDFSDNGIAT